MMLRSRMLRWRLFGAVLFIAVPVSRVVVAESAVPSEPWTPAQIVKPEELARKLEASKGAKPLVLQVGFRVLYAQAHIPGSKYCGTASTSKGLEKLKDCVQSYARDKDVVLYCGCCPWTECPTLRPAFRLLREMGFTRLRVLDIPNSFGQDWVAKGFPVEKGE